jgi:hypothetical protein
MEGGVWIVNCGAGYKMREATSVTRVESTPKKKVGLQGVNLHKLHKGEEMGSNEQDKRRKTKE